MKSAIALAAALALCGSAFAATTYHSHRTHGVVATVKQDAHRIGSSFRHDMHRVARGDTFRRDEAANQRDVRSHTRAMGAGPEYGHVSSGRQARMDAAYADWHRSHHYR